MAAFQYNISITGDCQNTNSGQIYLSLTGGTPPYTVDWIDPNLGTEVVTLLPSVRSSLSADTYSVRVNDSTLPANQEFYINIPVSSGVCANILGVQGTTCSLNNGSVTGSSSSDYSTTSFYLYDSNDNYIMSAITDLNEVIFGTLTAGTYYIAAVDLGGCTGYSSNFIVEDSDTLDFGLYVIPNSSCGGTPVGSIIITGVTGTPPYTYNWSTSSTGTTVTGLTSGTYSVSVTDFYGCVTTKSATIVDISPIGLGTFTAVQPSCFSADGSFTIQVTGGTAPYYYSASTGNIQIQYGTSWTVSGLSPGNYSVQVTDAALCSFVAGTVLTPPQGITSVNISSIGTTCSSDGGSIQVSVFGGTTPYIYTLIYPNGNTTNVTNTLTTQLFSNLGSGTYGVAVQDAAGCSYIDEITLFATNTYTISTEVTGTTCNQNNGLILVTRTEGGAPPYDYSLDGIQDILDTTLSAVTFTNVSSGQHTITVTDATGCTQTTQVYVNESEPLDFTLYSTSCGEGSDGTLTALISSGTPPFTFNWSNNVQNNPQQIQVTGLTADTYGLTIVDSLGCTLNRSTTVDCESLYVSYQTYVMGGEEFTIQSQTKYGLLQMLNEGFNDLTNDKVSCDLLSAVFGVKVSVNPMGLTTSQNFFTGTTLVSAPSDNLYYDTVKNLLLTIPGVGGVTIDALNNQITVTTDPNNTILNGEEIVVELTIVYDIICLSCVIPTPTPTITTTPTITPTITPTPTSTQNPTVTPTPTVTKTPTITPSVTPICSDDIIGTIGPIYNDFGVQRHPTLNAVYTTSYVSPTLGGGLYYGGTNSVSPLLIDGNLDNPSFMTINTTDNKLYLNVNNGLKIYNTLTNTLIQTITGRGSYFYLGGLAYNSSNNKVYASSASGITTGELLIIDEFGFQTFINGLPIRPLNQDGIIYNPISTNLYIVGQGNTVQIFNTTTNTIAGSINLSSVPKTLAYKGSTNQLFVVRDGHIDVVNCNTNAITATWTIPSIKPNSRSIVYNSVNDKLYLSTYSNYVFPLGYEASVVVINPNTGASLKTIPITPISVLGLGGIDFTPDNTIFVANPNLGLGQVIKICGSV